MPNKKEVRSASTRARILAVARDRFGRHGYAATALGEIVSEAGVTTGAVYHHFGDKRGLFQAVAESVEQEVLDDVTAFLAGRAADWEGLEAGVDRTLESLARPEIQRIIFDDAPSVIGLRAWREIEIRYAFGLLRGVLGELAKSGALSVKDPDMTAQIFLGAMIEAAHAVAAAGGTAGALREARSSLRAMLRSLKREA